MNDERDKSDPAGDSQDRLRFRNASEQRSDSTLHNYLQLMRLPAVFTAMADVTMGFLFVQWGGAQWRPTPWDFATLASLLAASSLLYLAGMVLNDVGPRLDRCRTPLRLAALGSGRGGRHGCAGFHRQPPLRRRGRDPGHHGSAL